MVEDPRHFGRFSRPGRADSPYAILMSSIFNEAKDRGRRRLLAERPELRLRVDTSRLKPIIDYVAFKCHPLSSIARDVAIQGSDIDGGLVVLREEVPPEPQFAFIEELRRQGFDVYHPTEAAAFRKQFDEHPISDRPKWDELSERATISYLNQIRFIPQSVLQEYKPIEGAPYLIYHAGYTIS